MSAHLGKIALMLVMTHGFRALGRFSNPRWAGLALGLPCSTAVALVGGGVDRGVDYAVAMSSTSLIGLAGAVALPMAFAKAVERGWRLPGAILAGVAAYLILAITAGRLLPPRGDASLVVALVAVASAIRIAGTIPPGDDRGSQVPSKRKSSSTRLLRPIVPILCLTGTLTMGEAFGPGMAGLMSTFPGVTLTVLLLTHLESGPSSSLRMARALPVGNLGMVAFLASFRLGCPTLGLAWGTLLAYVAALAMLTVVLGFDRLRGSARRQWRAWQASICLLIAFDREMSGHDWTRRPAPRACRRFSPLIEPFAA